MDKIKQKHTLLQLLMSDDLAELHAKSKHKFNIFRALKLQNNEVKHSNFLGWLLNPFESHNLMDTFLKELLKVALKNDTSLVDIILKDLTDAKIKLEKMANDGRRIDIFIDCPRSKLVCVIENKVWSGEGCNQLEDYRNYVLNHDKYKDYEHKIFLFLTPYKYTPCEAYKGYIRINYGDILIAINNSMKQCDCLLDDDVKIFIEHYKKMVERDIMGNYDAEILELCSKIYKEYGDAIDLIYKCGTPQKALCSILIEVLEQKDYVKRIHRESDSVVLALPIEITEEQLKKIQIADWKPDNCFVNIKFSILQWNSEKVTIEILFAPLQSDYGKDLKEKFKKALINKNKNFKFDNNKEGWEWTNLDTLISLDEYMSYDNNEEVKNHISEKLDSFKEKYIDTLKEVINEIIH